MMDKDLTVTVGRISVARQGAVAGTSRAGLKLRDFHGALPYTPDYDRMWPAEADIFADELTKIREALLTAKTLLETPKRADKATLARLLAELEIV